MNPLLFTYEALGTHWKITVWDELSSEQWTALKDKISQISTEFDQTYSRFIKTSLVWQLTQKRGVITVPSDFMAMLTWYQKLYVPSYKKLNPLVGFTLSDLGYDATYSLTPQASVRPTPDLNTAVRVIDQNHIELTESVLFDFGALGKGYLVDKIAELLKNSGLKQYLVDGSGDINYQGNGAPIRLGLEDPGDPTKVIGVLEMTKGALCGSGTNRRQWAGYHHIIDPDTKNSTTDIIAAWVLSDSATISDALATALFLAEPERFSSFKFDYCLLNKDYKIKRSAGFTAELF